MILVDTEIEHLIDRGVIAGDSPVELKSNVQPASLDVRVGYRLLLENQPNWLLRWLRWLHPSLKRRLEEAKEKEWIEINLNFYSKEHPFWLKPNHFVLAETIELFALDPDLAADFMLRSSAAREGYNNLLAGWCDPGWGHGGMEKRSRLTLELKNSRRWKPLPLYPGLRIGQIVFYRLHKTPLRPYNLKGRYNGDQSVQASRGL